MTLLLFSSLVGVFYTAFSVLRARRSRFVERVNLVKQGPLRQRTGYAIRRIQGLRALRHMNQRIAERLFSQSSQPFLDTVQAKLAAAGYPLAMRPVEWLGLRFLCTALAFCMGLFYGVAVGGSKGVLMLLVIALLGWMAPNLWLSRRVQNRQQSIARQLPSALDLLTISVEAGLGFDQALAKVAEKFTGPVAEEFARTIREIQLGATRAEAMQRLGTRAGVDALRVFASAIIQADRLGSGLARTLRIQSDALRERHRLDAQERALKAPVKMVIPLVIFVFPSVFIIVLGPAMIHVVEMFKNGSGL